LSREADQAVSRLLCNLVTSWVKRHRQLPPSVFAAIAPIPDRLLAKNLFEGGTARALMDSLKAIAQSEALTIDILALSDLVLQLLTAINLAQVRNSESEMIDLLCAINRLSPSFMATVIYQGCPILVEQGWLRNVSAVVKAAATIEGGRSPLLDRLQQLDCCTPPVDSMILAVRGL
jgi:hypothetical protein